MVIMTRYLVVVCKTFGVALLFCSACSDFKMMIKVLNPRSHGSHETLEITKPIPWGSI